VKSKLYKKVQNIRITVKITATIFYKKKLKLVPNLTKLHNTLDQDNIGQGPWASEGFFRGGPKVVKFVFFPLKTKKTTIFCKKFQNPGGPRSSLTSLSTPMLRGKNALRLRGRKPLAFRPYIV